MIRLTDDIKNYVRSFSSRTQAQKYLRKTFNVGERQAQRYYNAIVSDNRKSVSITNEDDNKLCVESDVEANIRTIDDLIAESNIDLNVWQVKKVVSNSYAGKFQIKAEFERKKDESNFDSLLKLFQTEAAKHAPKKFVLSKTNTKADCLFVLNIQDLHLSKLAWGRETGGADYDMHIAKEVFRGAIADLLSKAPLDRIEEILMIVGSDFFQVDTDKSTTTAGTYVDSDTRASKAFEEGCKLFVEVVEELSARFKVRLVVVSGNHDHNTSQYLGHYLAAWFRNNRNVFIQNSPTNRKYVGYGVNLIGLTHGNEEKLADLPLIMMRENQKVVSNFKYFEWLTGHLHTEGVKEINGVKIRTAPALCPADKWHSNKGYVGTIRTSQGILYNKANGLEAIFYSNPLD